MKPWDEMWSCSTEDASHIDHPDGSQSSIDGVTDADAFARARLAAAAPDLARALLAVEWGGLTCYGSAAACPFCSEDQAYGKHAPECTLAAALKRAGVR
jgi:hypothetical protein